MSEIMCIKNILGKVYLLVAFIVSVSSISLKGSSETRYRPCGLGLLHFDRSPTNDKWMGVLNLALQPGLFAPSIELKFKVPIVYAWSSENVLHMKDNNAKVITIRPRGKIPKRLIFFLQAENNVVPYIQTLSINGKVLCSDLVKSRQLELEDDLHSEHVCGRRSIQHAEMSTVGGDAVSGQWPWHIAILLRDINDPDEMMYFCGGSIISRTAILTAGHCVAKQRDIFDLNRFVVYAGTANISDKRAPGFQTLKVRKIVIHPAYDETLATADLAIIKVDAFKFTEYVQPICIWGPVFKKSQLFGVYATMVGYGRTEDDDFPDVLRSIHTMVQSDKTCLTYAPNLYPKLLTEFSFCAGFGPESTINPRNGDSGGGLVLPVQQSDGKISWFIRGVLSKCGMDDGCTLCDPKYYVVYTDVAAHYSWVYLNSGLKYKANIMHY